jgi:regulator of RNase E activity RraB
LTPNVKAKPPVPGDVIEIFTGRGLAYAQYTHEDRGFYGSLIRVLPGIFEARPSDLRSLVAERERFWTFISLKEAVQAKDLAIVGHEEIPARARVFPVLRLAGAIDANGEVLNWLLWDGTKKWKIPQLTPDYAKLSIASVWGIELLEKRVASDWSPPDGLRDHVDSESPGNGMPPNDGSVFASDGAVLEELERAGGKLDVAHPVEHLLILRSKAASDGARKLLIERGYTVGHAVSTEDEQWLLTAVHSLVLSEESIDRARAELEAIAHQFEGEYDGWEAAVDPSSSGPPATLQDN